MKPKGGGYRPSQGKDPHDGGGIKKIKWDRSGKPRPNLWPNFPRIPVGHLRGGIIG